MDPVVELDEANDIVRKILSKQTVSDEEFRYAVLFNLTAMTQLLWEISNKDGNPPRKENRPGPSVSGLDDVQRNVRNMAWKLAPFAAIAAFLAGLGLGYLIP